MKEDGGGKGVPECGVWADREGPDQICVETVVGAANDGFWASISMSWLIDRFGTAAGRFIVTGCVDFGVRLKRAVGRLM